MSPYACIAVSVEVLDQVHQFRGQAPSPKYCPQYPTIIIPAIITIIMII